MFVLHSDGIYDTRNDRDETCSLDRLGQVIAAHANENAESRRNGVAKIA